LTGTHTSDLSRTTKLTGSTLHVVGQQFNADVTHITVTPPTSPIANLDETLSHAPGELQNVSFIMVQRAGQPEVMGHQALQILKQLTKILGE